MQIAQLFSFVHLAKIILYNIELEIRKSHKHLLNLTVFPNRLAEQQKSHLKSLEITDTVQLSRAHKGTESKPDE